VDIIEITLVDFPRASMQTRLTAATEIAMFIIFDPASIPANAINPTRPVNGIDTTTDPDPAPWLANLREVHK
jgi:hypothetical protein